MKKKVQKVKKRNKVAKDLLTNPLYRYKVVPNKKKHQKEIPDEV